MTTSSPIETLQLILEDTINPKYSEMTKFLENLKNSDIGNIFYGQAVEERRTITRKPKDPNRKKRPANAFLLYRTAQYSEARACLVEQNPELTGAELRNEISRVIGEAWKSSTDEQKKPYIDKANKLKEPTCMIESDSE